MTAINSKKIAADKALTYIKDGMILGLGTGSTAYWAIEGIGEKIKKEGLKVSAIATSVQSENQARDLGIPIVSFAEIDRIDLTIDGADEADLQRNLIKGGGGALLREKIVASNSRQLFIIVDQHKLVDCLGKFELPVESVIFGWEKTFTKLADLGSFPRLRSIQDKPFITDNGNYIIDCAFKKIPHPVLLHDQINAITGVVDNGLFINLASKIIVGYDNGEVRIID
jgi:ribose 5-phosphate isomerase A